jgi:hypothetical protein
MIKHFEQFITLDEVVDESINDIDPYGEENWGDREIKDLYLVYVLGQDENFLTQRRQVGNGRWPDYYYFIASLRDGDFHFNSGAWERAPYPPKDIDKVLNGEKLVGYIEERGGLTVRFDTLQNLCDRMEITIEQINFLR